MDNQKYINGVPVSIEDNQLYCDYDNYIKARKQQNKKYSEKFFCNWCDDNNIIPIG